MKERDIEAGFFTAKDFKGIVYERPFLYPTEIVGRANAILRDWVKQQPEVFSEARYIDGVNVCQEWDESQHGIDTHSARLICVKELGE